MSGRKRKRTSPAHTSGGRGRAGALLVSSFEKRSIGSSAPSLAGPQVMKQQRPVQNPAPAPAPADAPESPLDLLPPSMKRHAFPARNGYGQTGYACSIMANHFLVDLGKKEVLYQYDVKITPNGNSKAKRRAIMNQFGKLCNAEWVRMQLAYDGENNLFAPGALPFTELMVNLPHQGDFMVTLKRSAIMNLHNLRSFFSGNQVIHDQLETIHALREFLKACASTTKSSIKIKQTLYSPQFGSGKLSEGVEYWKGFYQSLQPTQLGLSLIMNTAASCFYERMLVTVFVRKFLHIDISRKLSYHECLKIEKTLKGKWVVVFRKKEGDRQNDSIRRYKVKGLTSQPLDELTLNDGVTPIIKYFKNRYGDEFNFPHLPAIQAEIKGGPTYLPMELCEIASGQSYLLKLTERQVQKFLDTMCERPDDKKASIMELMKRNKYNSNDILSKVSGMTFREQLTSVNARVLPAPLIMYKDDTIVEPLSGEWRLAEPVKFMNGGTVNHWAILNFSKERDSSVLNFCRALVSLCIDKGMVFERQPLIPVFSTLSDDIREALSELMRRAHGKQLQMLFVILEDDQTYERIKLVCETQFGIVSQCCKPETVKNRSFNRLLNMASKINVKVGGRNHVLYLANVRRLPCVSDRKTIIFGADVTHPSPGENFPSIAAVVASMDWPEITKYKALVSSQRAGQEIIQDMYTTSTDSTGHIIDGGLIREQFLSFYRSTRGRKPEQVIFYRDGISENEFNAVLLREVVSIRRACASIEDYYQPRITFIVIQKRHKTQFFPSNNDDRGKNGNILPGTVVDTEICHPTGFDFYLCSHDGTKGTSRAKHYHVLYDENKFTADELQRLTYSLCHTYARTRRSISIVPPAYYAHLAAKRARKYMAVGDDSRGACTTRDRAAAVKPVPAIHENIRRGMFYL